MCKELPIPTLDEVKFHEWDSPFTFRRDGILYIVNADCSISIVQEKEAAGVK